MRLLAIILTLSISGLLRAQGTADVRIIEQLPGSVTFEYVPSVVLMPVPTANGGSLIRFHVPGGMTDSAAGDAFPLRKIPVFLNSARITAQLITAEYSDRGDLHPLTRLRFVPNGETGPRMIATGEPSSSVKRMMLPVEVIERRLGSRGNVAVIAVRPAVQQPDGRIRLYRKMTIRIDTDPTVPAGRLLAFMNGSAPALSTSADRTVRRMTTDSPLALGTWYRFDVTEDGVYKIDADFFRRSNIAQAAVGNIQSIRIFGNGGRVLPEDLTALRPNDLQEVARYVVDRNGNGVLDAGDYVAFFGQAAGGWRYAPAQRTFRHFLHPYAARNSYFITFGGGAGRAMDSVASVAPGTLPAVSDAPEHLFLEQEKFNLLKSGREWVGDSFDPKYNPSRVYATSLPGIVDAAPILYRFRILSRSATEDTMTVYENDQPLAGPVPMYPVDVSTGNNEYDYAYAVTIDPVTRTSNIPGARSLLKFRFGSGNEDALAWLDWFEIHYRRSLTAVNDELLFTTPDSTAAYAATVRNLSSRDVLVLDVTDHANVRRVSPVTFDPVDASRCTFGVLCSSGSVRRFAVVGPGGYRTASAASPVATSNLHGVLQPVDFVIVAPSAFAGEAQRLAAHRQAHDSLRTLVVDIASIYNEFSGGLQDPFAIRDFLVYARNHWPTPPRYVLLFGHGHYDYKNIVSSAPNWVPPYETPESIYQIGSYNSDDFLAFLDTNTYRISIPIGRLPVRTEAEASSVVDKLISYDNTAPYDGWRKRATFIADDGILGDGGNDGNMHTVPAEELANIYTPNLFEKQKIYLIDYPIVNTAVGRRKPAVNQAIVSAINEGTLITNYTGHGNERLWSYEAVFTREVDLPQLVNKDRLTFLVGATCNYAQFDDPVSQSAGEIILVMRNGGAMGELTSTRAVFSTDNAALNETFYVFLFQKDVHGEPVRIGDAMWETKQVHNGTNDQKYHLLGDPTARLAMPRNDMRIDSLNGSTAASVVTIPTLGVVRLQGGVRRPDGSAWSSFAGRAIVELSDARQTVYVPDWGNWSFSKAGSTLYRGEVTVTNGKFLALMPVPKDVSFGGNARISFYGWDGTTDAAGYTENVLIAGTDSTVRRDSTGPTVGIFVNDLAFRSGDPVPPNPTLIVRLQDASGINTSSVGIGHRLEARVTNPDEVINLSGSYQTDLDSYQSGEARVQLSGLPSGMHEITVKAWDILNNSTVASALVDVRSTDGLTISNLFPYPNPTTGPTSFTFTRPSTDAIDVTVKVYSVAGRLLEHLERRSVTDRLVVIPWDGRDADGDHVANGVYFYRVVARSLTTGESAEAIGKVAILK